MEELLKTLSVYAKQPRLVPAEQILTTALLDFETLVSPEMSDSERENIEKVLLSLFTINRGQLSFQCSVRIATCLLAIYKTSSPPKVWNLFQTVTAKPTSSNVIATGFIIDQIGTSCRSMIPGLAQKVIGLSSEMILPALYTITQCFKRDSKDMEKLAKKAFALAKKGISGGTEAVQLSALKLLRCLISVTDIGEKKLISMAASVFKDSNSKYVRDAAANLLARIFAAQVKHLEKEPGADERDFSVGKKDDAKRNAMSASLLNQVFTSMSEFPDEFHSILMHFLNLLKPKVIVMNLPILFKLVRKAKQSELGQLISLFGPDVRKELFASISKENPPSASQLKLLMDIQCDYLETRELAALAMQLTQCDNRDARKAGAQFFGKLAKTHPEHAELYLETAVLYLATPPEDNPTLEAEIRGFGLIAAKVLANVPNRNMVANKVAGNISIFLKRALTKCKVKSNSFHAAFTLMAELPHYLIEKDLVEGALSKFIDAIAATEVGSGDSFRKMRCAVCGFLEAHIQHYMDTGVRIIRLLFDRRNVLSNKAMLYLLGALPQVVGMLSQEDAFYIVFDITNWFTLSKPTRRAVMKMLNNPMLTKDELIELSKSDESTGSSGKILRKYPALIASLPKHLIEQVVLMLVQCEVDDPLMECSLLLSLCDNQQTSKDMVEDVPVLLLEKMESEKSLEVLQVAAECIAAWLKTHQHYYQQIVESAKSLGGMQRCLLYAAIFSKSELPCGAVTPLMNELDSLALNSADAVYALYALSILFKTYSTELAAMQVTDIQCQVILSLLNTPLALDPYCLLYMSVCCANLLPVIRPELSSTESTALPMMKSVIRAFRYLRLPFCKQIMYRTMRSVYVFAKELAEQTELTFPSEEGTSMLLKLTACGAFADLMKVEKPAVDFFNIVPLVLVLLQRTRDSRASEFLISMANAFVNSNDASSESARARLVEWIGIVKTVLATNQLPGTGSGITVESGDSVKVAALNIASVLLPMLAESKPLMGEPLDDIMTSVTRSIETKKPDIMNAAYSLLLKIVCEFEGVVVDGESRLLVLYDSQFSIAVRFGFMCDLAFSGDLLAHYLDFHLEESKAEGCKTIFTTYVEGLNKQENASGAYYKLASHITKVARNNTKVLFPLMKDFASKLIEQFCEVISISMALWRSDPCDWQQIQEFRKSYADTYGDIVASFFWLESQVGTELLPTDSLVIFYTEEIKSANDFWRVEAAYRALSAAFQCFKGSISAELVDQAIDFARSCTEPNVVPLTTAFLQDCTVAMGASSNWSQLMKFAVSSGFNAQSYATLINDGTSEQLVEFVNSIGQQIASAYAQKVIDARKAVALFTIMFDKSETLTGALLQFFDSSDAKDLTPLKLDLYRRALRRCTDDAAAPFIQSASTYAWTSFKQGGMQMLAQLLIKNPSVGVSLVAHDNLESMKSLCLVDVANCAVYMQFIRFAYETIKANKLSRPDFAISAVKLAVETMNKWSDDIANGSPVSQNCIHLIYEINKSEGSAVKVAFAQLEDKPGAVKSVEKELARMESKRKVHNLKTFSSNTRKIQDSGEWQDLEVGDL